MGKLEIRDLCIAPDEKIYLRYEGKDPWDVVGKITSSIRPFFHVSASGTNNTRINWDISGDPITFFAQWWVKKVFSRFSVMRLFLKVQGEQKKTTGMGKFSMQLRPRLETNVQGFSLLLKPLWYMYSFLFYNRVRRKYVEKCREYTESFRNEIKEHFSLEPGLSPAPRTAVR